MAGALSSVAFFASLRALRRCQIAARAAATAATEEDDVERRLAERERALVLGLGSRNVLALGRVALFGGTGCAVWQLTGGSAHYLSAGAAFGLGFAGWASCGEIHRRVGSLADRRRALRKRAG